MPDQIQTRFSKAILAEIPHLRAYALLMTNDVSSTDNEVTETLKRVLSNMERLQERTDLRVELFTILRSFLVISGRALKKVDALPAIYERLKGPFRVISRGFTEKPIGLPSALLCLAFEEREAVVLSAGVGLTCEDAAKIIGCGLPEYDARMRRGFARLAELVPTPVPMTSGGNTASYAFSGTHKALELQETPAY